MITTTTEDLVIPKDLLAKMHMSRDEMLIELAVHLYDIRRLTMGQAKRLAGIDQIAFQHEMAKRNVYLNYDVEEFRKDLETLGIEVKR
ncbi:MAG: UPF0175 family protein [Pyrinomonadaceae bacterium]